MDPLLDAILEHVPPPPGDPNGQFAMLVTMTERDLFLGRVATGRIASGQIKVGDKIKVLRHNGEDVRVCASTMHLDSRGQLGASSQYSFNCIIHVSVESLAAVMKLCPTALCLCELHLWCAER